MVKERIVQGGNALITDDDDPDFGQVETTTIGTGTPTTRKCVRSGTAFKI